MRHHRSSRPAPRSRGDALRPIADGREPRHRGPTLSDDNPFASLVGDKLAVSKEDALEIPRRVRDLKRLIATRIPRIRLEDLFVEVDSWVRRATAGEPHPKASATPYKPAPCSRRSIRAASATTIARSRSTRTSRTSVFGERAISCGEREASYVLDALLESDSILEIREHHTDTHGSTEHIFALCHLLGFSFMPLSAFDSPTGPRKGTLDGSPAARSRQEEGGACSSSFRRA